MKHGVWRGVKVGVPATPGSAVLTSFSVSYGQACTHSPHLMQVAAKSRSAIAPGGRNGTAARACCSSSAYQASPPHAAAAVPCDAATMN